MGGAGTLGDGRHPYMHEALQAERQNWGYEGKRSCPGVSGHILASGLANFKGGPYRRMREREREIDMQ